MNIRKSYKRFPQLDRTIGL